MKLESPPPLCEQPDILERIAPANRPAGKPIGYHQWRNLLFAHWSVPVEVVQPLLPKSLTVDTYDGKAWVGLVPFEMHGIRPWWSPAVPGVSSFYETNVRTYVHRAGKDPGVWFFSLDASSSLAVRIARWRWHLAYYKAMMSVRKTETYIIYKSHRLWPGKAGVSSHIKLELGDYLHESVDVIQPGCPAPGTLEHWLVERYILYAEKRDGLLLKGHVHHPRYKVREAKLLHLEESLVEAVGIPNCENPEHLLFCDGVDVDIFPLMPQQ